MVTRHAGTGFTSSEVKNRQETERREEFMFETEHFEGEPAVVEVTLGMTVNLGNFESARLDVGVRMPCTPENVEATFAKAKAWCEEKVGTEVRQIRKQ